MIEGIPASNSMAMPIGRLPKLRRHSRRIYPAPLSTIIAMLQSRCRYRFLSRVSHRIVARCAAPADRHLHRNYSRNSFYHLRHLGLFIFAPFLQQYVQPFLISVFGHVPVLSTLFEGPPYGIGMLTAGLILAIMVLPFITSISRDVFERCRPCSRKRPMGWLHHLGSGALRRVALYPRRRDRRCGCSALAAPR